MTNRQILTWIKAAFDKRNPKAWRRINPAQRQVLAIRYEHMAKAQIVYDNALFAYRDYAEQLLRRIERR